MFSAGFTSMRRMYLGRSGRGSLRAGVGGHSPGRGAAVVVVAGGVVAVVGAAVVDVEVDVVDRSAASSDFEHAAAVSNMASDSNKTVAVALTPTCVWRVSTPLILALDERFGEPVDAYVNGSQVWLRDDGPNELTIEYRLHPVSGFRRPKDVGTYELFPGVALALATGGTPPARPESLWDGLEAFAAYGDEVEPAVLSGAATAALGLAPDAAGLVDHAAIGDEWERTGGKVSIVERLLAQLGA